MHKTTVALLGESAVGKSSLVRRFVLDQFSDGYLVTLGAKPMKKNLRIETEGGPEEIQMLIWDLVGQRGYHTVQERVLGGVQGVLLIYDATRDETRESITSYWIPRMNDMDLHVPEVLVGNKLDLVDDRWAALARLKDFAGQARSFGGQFLTSAKTGEGVEDAFLFLAASIMAGSIPPMLRREVGASKEVDPLVSVMDRIITDFCDEYGGVERGMSHVQREAARAGLDVRAPTWEAVRLFIQNLSEIDRRFRTAKAADAQARRLAWLWEAASVSHR